MVQPLFLLLYALLGLLLPLVLLTLHPLLQSGVIEIVLAFLVVLALDAVVDLVILIEALLLCISDGLPVMLSEDCLGGL